MASFVYDPDAMRAWSNQVVNLLTHGPGSVKGQSITFNILMERLSQPNVWTGAAAYQNFKNFQEAHQALINFTNNFGNAFSSEMQSIAQKVEGLEVSNLGADSDVTARFGQLDYEGLNAACEANINKEVITYDYSEIDAIGRDLRSVKNSLEELKGQIINVIRELGSGRKIWDGEAANSARENLETTVNTNMTKVFEALDICIGNISQAAAAAQGMDRTEGPSNVASDGGSTSFTSMGVGPGYASTETTSASSSETTLQPGNTAGPGGGIP